MRSRDYSLDLVRDRSVDGAVRGDAFDLDGDQTR